jgi:hypothetical protein
MFEEKWQENENRRLSIERGKVSLNQLKAQARI